MRTQFDINIAKEKFFYPQKVFRNFIGCRLEKTSDGKFNWKLFWRLLSAHQQFEVLLKRSLPSRRNVYA